MVDPQLQIEPGMKVFGHETSGRLALGAIQYSVQKAERNTSRYKRSVYVVKPIKAVIPLHQKYRMIDLVMVWLRKITRRFLADEQTGDFAAATPLLLKDSFLGHGICHLHRRQTNAGGIGILNNRRSCMIPYSRQVYSP